VSEPGARDPGIVQLKERLLALSGVDDVERPDPLRSVLASLSGLSQDVAGLESRLAAIEDELDGLAERWESFSRSGTRETHDRVAALGEAVTLARTELAGLRSEVSTVGAERLARLESGLAGLTSAVGESVDDLAEAVESSLGALAGAVDASLEEQFSAEQVLSLDPSAVTDVAAEVERRLDGSLARPADLAALRTEMAAATAAMAERVEGALRDQIADLSRQVSELSAEREALRDGVRAELDRLTGSADARLAELTSRSITTMDELRVRVGDELAASRETVRSGVEGLREQLSDELLALADWTRREHAAVRDSTRAQLDELTVTTREALQRATATAQSAVARLSEELAEQAEAARASLATRVNERLGAVSDAVLAGLAEHRGSGKVLEQIEARLVATGRLMLDYLSERDLALEAERDRVLHQLLEDVAAGVPAAERTRMTSRASELLERRRAARDAARWRESQLPGGSSPRLDVDALAERLRVDEPDPLPEPEGVAEPAVAEQLPVKKVRQRRRPRSQAPPDPDLAPAAPAPAAAASAPPAPADQIPPEPTSAHAPSAGPASAEPTPPDPTSAHDSIPADPSPAAEIPSGSSPELLQQPAPDPYPDAYPDPYADPYPDPASDLSSTQEIVPLSALFDRQDDPPGFPSESPDA
jgi:hypothetical protein